MVNADESEPGACKDIPTMLANPHALIEGLIIAAFAIRADKAFIYLRGEVLHVIRRVQHAVAEAREAGYLGPDILGSGFDLDVVVHCGAGAYICGEETALLDSLEGFRGQPRLKPPFPAIAGLYACPTVVNNVETIASIPFIVADGADGVRRARHGEVHGLRHLLAVRARDHAGPVRGGPRHYPPRAARLGGRHPGRALAQVLDPGRVIDAHFHRASTSTCRSTTSRWPPPDSMLGTRSLQIFDETTCVLRVVLRWTEFYQHESCGKCTPCREGTYWMVQVLEQLERGQGSEADLAKLLDICDNIVGRAFCALGDAAASPVDLLDQVFPGRVHRAPDPRRLPVRPGGFRAVRQGAGDDHRGERGHPGGRSPGWPTASP